MEIDQSIFKAYDIRGLVPGQLNAELAYKLGCAIVKFLECKKVVVGRDMRDSSEELSAELIRGINDMGADVLDIGLCTTPMNYYANGMYDADASVMVTASHNPAGWNGFKICRAKAVPLSGESGIMDLKQLVIEDNFELAETKGKKTDKEIKKNYCDFLASHFHNPDRKEIKVVADCANAMGVLELECLKILPGLKIIPLYDELDSSFPNHEANPLKEDTLIDLQAKVIDEQAALGIAFDGDADRCGFVDEEGEIIRSDFITALIAKDILKEKPGSKIFYDLRSSKVVKETIEENKGEALMCRVGHAFIKQQMREEEAIFAGELSGHYYFAENYNAESSGLAAIRILNMLISSGEKLSELSAELKQYYQSGEINRKVSDSKKIIDKIKEKYSDGNIFFLDGVSVEFPDFWFNIRSSNTEPLLRLNLEAKDKEMMQKKTGEVLLLYEEPKDDESYTC